MTGNGRQAPERVAGAVRDPVHETGPEAPEPPPAAVTGPPDGEGLRPRRRRAVGLVFLAAACVGAGAVTGAIAAAEMPKAYGARVEFVYPIGQEEPTGFLRQDRTLSTQLVLLRSRSVLGSVAADHALDVDALRRRVSVAVLADSEVIRVQVRAPAPEEAMTLVRATVESYLAAAARGPDGEQARITAELDGLDTGLAAARERRAGLVAAALKAAPNASLDPVVAEVDAEIDPLRIRQNDLQARLAQSRLADRPEIATPAYALTDPVSPRPLLLASAGALLGLLVAVAAVALVVRRWTRPR